MVLKNSLSTHTNEEFSMAELVERTNTSSATIRYYFLEGLLPAPIKIAPNRFLYDERHVEAILLIRLFRERKQLSIESIKKLISDLLPDLHGRKDTGTFRPEMWQTILDFPKNGIGYDTVRKRLTQAGLGQLCQIGFDDLTIDDVCRKAEVAKGTFYNYFTSKEDFFTVIITEVGNELKVAAEQLLSGINLKTNSEIIPSLSGSFVNTNGSSRPSDNCGPGGTLLDKTVRTLYAGGDSGKPDDGTVSFICQLGCAFIPYIQVILDLLSLSIRRPLLFGSVMESLIENVVPAGFESPKQIFISATFAAISEKIS